MIWCPKKIKMISSIECLPHLCSFRTCSQKNEDEEPSSGISKIPMIDLKKTEEILKSIQKSIKLMQKHQLESIRSAKEEQQRKQEEWERIDWLRKFDPSPMDIALHMPHHPLNRLERARCLNDFRPDPYIY